MADVSSNEEEEPVVWEETENPTEEIITISLRNSAFFNAGFIFNDRF